jgi:hypothetical protein
MMGAFFTRRPAQIALVTALVAFGVALRVLGLRMGLPFQHHWDEAWIADSVIHMLVTETPVPETYQYGAPMMMLTVGVYEAFTRLVRDVSPDDAVMIRMMARCVGVAVSSSGIAAVYLAVRWGLDDARRALRAAPLAALLFAAASELVTHGRYAVTDACLVSLTAWTLALTARYIRTQHVGWGFGAVLAAGVTFAFKVTALPTAAVPLAAIVLVRGQLPVSARPLPYRLLLAGAVPIVLATFFALNPMCAHVDHVLDAVRDIIGRFLQTRFGGFPEYQRREEGLPHLEAAVWAVASLAFHRTPAVSLLLAVTGLAGLASAVRRGSLTFAIAAGHAALALVALSSNRAFLFRNYLVAAPALCMGFGVGVCNLLALSRRLLGARARWVTPAVATALAVALVAMPVRDAIACQRLSVDPRQRALQWIAERSPAGARVAFTPSIVGEPATGRPVDGAAWKIVPPKITHFDVSTCAEVQAAHPAPDYVLTASTQDGEDLVVWEERWFFQSCPGFVEVARFEPNPYEHNFAVTPAWNGRAISIVLAPQR